MCPTLDLWCIISGMENKEIKENSGLGDDLSPFSLFSVFLEWKVLDSTHPDLTCIPEEYVIYIIDAAAPKEPSGDIVHLMMLFTEHAQLDKTGVRKIQLSDEKYQKMAKEFAIFCKLELERRKGGVKDIMTAHVFNPNMKTVFFINDISQVSSLLMKELNDLHVSIQEST